MVKDLEAKRLKEIAKWEKEKAKPKWKSFIAYFVFVVGMIYVVQELGLHIHSYMGNIISQVLITPLTGNATNSATMMSFINYVTYLGPALAFLYKPLSDKYGRKTFIVINSIGLAFGLLLIGMTTNLPIYIIGALFVSFFSPRDIQTVYIQESAPAKHRGTIVSVLRSVATLGLFIISFLMDAFIDYDHNYEGWNMVYIVPAILILIIAIYALFAMRESDAFIEMRLNQLRNNEQPTKKKTKFKGGLINALKFCFSNKQVRWLLIAGGLIMFGNLVTADYSTILAYGYAKDEIASITAAAGTSEYTLALQQALSNATDIYVSKAFKLYAIGSASFLFFPGLISDKIGRKKTVVLTSFLSSLCFCLYFIGCNNYWNPYLVGFLCGAAVGSYGASNDLITLLASESSPTELRASVVSTYPLVSGTIYSLALYIQIAAKAIIMNDAYLGYTILFISIPGVIVGLIIMMFKVKDTSGIDLKEIPSNNK